MEDQMNTSANYYNIDLHEYDLVIVNSSGGKDSIAALSNIMAIAQEQSFPKQKICVSHQDLGVVEWRGTKELVKEQADCFGLKTYFSARRSKDGKNGDLLQYVEARGKWPSNKARFCTSDFKRGPGARIVTALTKGMKGVKVLYVFGFRAEESPARKKKEVLKRNDRLSNKSRIVDDFLPVHHWTVVDVWAEIKSKNLPYHYAYDLGMPRLSCCFCVFASFDALCIAGKENPELLDRYVEVENKIGHDFKKGMPIASVKQALQNGYEVKEAVSWSM